MGGEGGEDGGGEEGTYSSSQQGNSKMKLKVIVNEKFCMGNNMYASVMVIIAIA